MSAPNGWFVEDDTRGNPTLWAPNDEWPDFPVALLVRVSSNAVLFDGIGALLDALNESEPVEVGEPPC